MSQKKKDIESTLVEALKRRDAEERRTYLDATCGIDTKLRSEIDSLLRAYEDKNSLLEAPSDLLDEPIAPVTEGPDTVIGRYKLLEKIGEGGMAVVYMAEQEKPIRRKVALKIIKLGMDTKSVIARFEAERQALAMMDHPNIAKVLDAGATETGRPYFVMELVTGVSITEYCDKNNLSTKERLALFIQVCNAVQHAHQKGIIHRDIKPTNVMVTRHEGQPIPKVIDFGIAKATNQKLTEKTLFTRYAHIIGTPAYMSPEQADLGDMDVDTRSDIYSLGVLLYELLTGTTPFSEEELREAGYIEMQRVIREQEPPKPSTKLSTLGETLTDIAKYRGCTPDLLTKAIRGDLDWIVMRSLEKDRIRRYETANGLGMDVQRHLDSEPVLARGPSATYRLQKFLHRNRVQAVAALAIVVVIAVVGVILSEWSEDRRLLARAQEVQDGAILDGARISLSERDFPTALKDVESILDSEHVGPEAQLLYASILVEAQEPNEAIVKLENLLNERPKIAGAAHALLARIYLEGEGRDTGRLSKANEHRQEAEKLLPDIAEAHYLRALTAATIKETLRYLNKALDVGPDHYESRRMRASTHYCSRKFSLAAEDALSLTALNPKNPTGYTLRAAALRELGRREEAISCYSKAIEYTSSGEPQLIDLYSQRRETFMQMERYQEALLDAEKCVLLSGGQEVHQIHVFTTLVSLGRYEEAKAKYSQLYGSLPGRSPAFLAWCGKHVVDTLEAGRELPLPSADEPAFLPILEAKDMYLDLKSKGRRVITDGFHANWHPNQPKLAYSKGVHGVSGVVVHDLESQQSELLFVPGREPLYSPDGQYIAFVRDREVLPLDRLATDEKPDVQPQEQEDIWIMRSDGTEPRRIAHGREHHWSPDSERLFYTTIPYGLHSISISEADAAPVLVLSSPVYHPRVSPDNKYVGYVERNTTLTILDLSSRVMMAKWVSPMRIRQLCWAPNGPQFKPSGGYGDVAASLWIYDLELNDAVRVLIAPEVEWASWSPDGKQYALSMGYPFYDIWIADAEALGPGRTLEEHCLEMVSYYTRRIGATPKDAGNYFNRARYYEYLHDINNCHADMNSYAVLRGQEVQTSGFQFGTPENLGPIVNTPAGEFFPHPSADDLSLFFYRPNSQQCWWATRETKGGPWKTLEKLAPFRFTTFRPGIHIPGMTTADGLELYLHAPGEHSDTDIFVRRREAIGDDWGDPVNLGSVVNSRAGETRAAITADGLELYFRDHYNNFRPGGCGSADIWVTRRATRDDPWSEPVNLGPPINSPAADDCPYISADGLLLFFHSFRPGGLGSGDLYVARRASRSDPWEEPVNLGPSVNSPAAEYSPHLSADGSTLYFEGNRPGGYGDVDIWQVPILRRDY